MRNVLGKYNLAVANSSRDKINATLCEELQAQINDWGMRVLNVELKSIEPTGRVQESMNNIIIAEQGKIAAEYDAHAAEVKADGEKRAAIKDAEWTARAQILDAEAKAETIRLEASAKADAIRMEASAKADAVSLEGKAVDDVGTDRVLRYWGLRTTENALKNNTKLLLPQNGSGMWNVLDVAKAVSEK